MCRRVTLPRGANSSSDSGASARASAAGLAAPRPPAIATSIAKSRRVTSMGAEPVPSVANAGNADRLALVERRQEELELGVLDGVGGEHVRAERRHAPL